MKKLTDAFAIHTVYTRIAMAFCAAMAAALCAACGSGAPAESAELPAPTAPAGSEYAGRLVISEIMAKNTASLMDNTGAFPDWIEIENVSDAPIALAGFTLADGEDENGWALPAYTIAPGEYLVIYADGTDDPGIPMHTDFALSEGETVCLRDARGSLIDRAECTGGKAGIALARNAAHEWEETCWCTPGYENTREGYDAWQESLAVPSPLVISEAVTASSGSQEQTNTGGCDWVEIKNVSSAPLSLGEYCLSDDDDALGLWAFPDMTLAAGESVIVICDKSGKAAGAEQLCAPFELSADGEALYLTRGGRVEDYVFLHDVPADGSMGRMDGENGWFYFASAQPGAKKTGGARRVSAAPVCTSGDGVYDGVTALDVVLEAAPGASIYYTLDGSAPTEADFPYSGLITLAKTTVVRALAVEPGALASRAATYSFIINEGHTLPVVSLAADDPAEFGLMYGGGKKNMELAGNIAFYGVEGSFSLPCGIDMHGETSLAMPKKNMGIHFRGEYGASELDYDLFSGGVTSFKALVLRAGQDQNASIIRNELLENLCLQYSDKVPTQRSRYCVLYINGEYKGIYALMEKVNEQHYARLMGVSRDSVTVMKAWANPGSEYYETVIRFAQENDLTDAKNYARFCELVDIDCLIDWMIIEGYSANTDLSTGNLRYARSTEGDGKWRFMLYDMDATLRASGSIFGNVLKPSSTQSAVFITQLVNNPDFRARFLSRAGEVLSTTLSNANVDAEIVRLAAEIEPEVARDCVFNKTTPAQWRSAVAELRATITERDWNAKCIAAIGQYMKLSPEEMQEYFYR